MTQLPMEKSSPSGTLARIWGPSHQRAATSTPAANLARCVLGLSSGQKPNECFMQLPNKMPLTSGLATCLSTNSWPNLWESEKQSFITSCFPQRNRHSKNGLRTIKARDNDQSNPEINQKIIPYICSLYPPQNGHTESDTLGRQKQSFSDTEDLQAAIRLIHPTYILRDLPQQSMGFESKQKALSHQQNQITGLFPCKNQGFLILYLMKNISLSTYNIQMLADKIQGLSNTKPIFPATEITTTLQQLIDRQNDDLRLNQGRKLKMNQWIQAQTQIAKIDAFWPMPDRAISDPIEIEWRLAMQALLWMLCCTPCVFNQIGCLTGQQGCHIGLF